MGQPTLNIAMVTPQWLKTKGGPTTYVSNLVTNLRRGGHEVYVLTNEAGEGVLHFRGELFLRIVSIYKYLKMLKPNIVHIHGRVNYIAPAWLYKIFCTPEAKLVITFHTMPNVHSFLQIAPPLKKNYSGLRKALAKFLLRRCDTVASVSGSIVTALNQYYKMGIHNCVVIPSGASNVTVDLVRVESIKDQYALHDNKPVLCTVGVMSWDWKVLGQQICIEAVDLLRRQFPNIRLMVAGDGRFRKYLEDIVHQREMEGCVTFLGNIDFIPELLHISDIYVHMALNEGCPHAVIEAMWAKKPIVVANRGGIPEIVEDNVTGLLIEPKAEDLAGAIKRLIEDEQKSRSMANNAYEYASSVLNWEIITDKYLNLYKGK